MGKWEKVHAVSTKASPMPVLAGHDHVRQKWSEELFCLLSCLAGSASGRCYGRGLFSAVTQPADDRRGQFHQGASWERVPEVVALGQALANKVASGCDISGDIESAWKISCCQRVRTTSRPVYTVEVGAATSAAENFLSSSPAASWLEQLCATILTEVG